MSCVCHFSTHSKTGFGQALVLYWRQTWMWPVWVSNNATSQPNSFERRCCWDTVTGLPDCCWLGGRGNCIGLVAWPYCLVALDSKARCCAATAALLFILLTLAIVSLQLFLPYLPWICPPCLSLLLFSSLFHLFYGWLLQASFCLLRLLHYFQAM